MKRTLERHSDGAGDLRSNGGCGGTPLGGALVASSTILLHKCSSNKTVPTLPSK